MASPRKKAAKKAATPKKRKAPAKKLTEEKIIEETMAKFLWTLCGLGSSLKAFEEYEAVIGAYQRLKAPARKELRALAAQAVLGLRSIAGLVHRERGESGSGKR